MPTPVSIIESYALAMVDIKGNYERAEKQRAELCTRWLRMKYRGRLLINLMLWAWHRRTSWVK